MHTDSFIGNLAPVTLSDGESLTTEIQVFKQGTFRKGGRTIKVGQTEIENAIRNFDAKVAGEPPLDYDHSFDYGGTSEASGWYKRLYMKDGALWATVEFTQGAVEKIRAKAYRFFSPTFSADWPDESGKKHGFTLLAGALTNRPFLKNMAPITLSENFSPDELTEIKTEIDSFGAQIDSALAISERGRDMGIFKNDPTEDKATIETLTEEVTTLKAEAEKVNTLSEQVDTLSAERDDLKSKLEAAESGKGEAETKVEALTERIETVEKDRFTEKLADCLTTHRKRGAIDATDETTSKWTTRAEKHGVEFIADLLSDIPDEAAVAMGEIGHGNDRKPSNAPEGVDPDAHQLDERINKLAEEKDISYEEAADQIHAEGVAS